MLWSLALRAHAPMDAGRNFTFAASRISAASARVIQSEADRGIGQSAAGPAGAGVDVPPSLAAPLSLPLDSGLGLSFLLSPLSDDDESLDDEDDFRADVELRSFFAQPVPLKWMLGALNALRTVAAPQFGQRSGPASYTPWTTSNRRPQVEQT